jgi:hypothetical protein
LAGSLFVFFPGAAFRGLSSSSAAALRLPAMVMGWWDGAGVWQQIWRRRIASIQGLFNAEGKTDANNCYVGKQLQGDG